MTLNQIINLHGSRIVETARLHGARNVRIFGSFARGQAGSHSDIDLLVRLEDGRTLLDLIAIKQELEAYLQCNVDVVTENGLSPYIRDEVLKEAVAI